MSKESLRSLPPVFGKFQGRRDVAGSRNFPSIKPFDAIRILLGSALLIAAGLKGYQLSTEPIRAIRWVDSRWFLIALVEFELLFGIWLIAGLYPEPTRYFAMACFLAFGLVSVEKIVTSQEACGCLGKVNASPWHSLFFNLAALSLLCVFRPARSGSNQAFGNHRLATVVALWCCLGIPVAVFATGLARAKEPSLVVDSNTVYIGRGKVGDVVTGEVVLRNVGNADLNISEIQTSRVCASITPGAPFAIAAGDFQVLDVGIRLLNENGIQSTHLQIHSDDAERPVYPILVTARADSFALVSPPSLYLGKLVRGEQKSATIKILSPSGQPSGSSSELEVAANSPFIHINPASEIHGGYTVTVAGQLPLGTFASEVIVRNRKDGSTVSVPVIARVCPRFLAIPSELCIGNAVNSEESHLAIVKRVDGRSFGPIEHTICPGYLTVYEEGAFKDAEARTETRLRIRVLGQRKVEADQVTIWFERSPHPAIIRLKKRN